MNENKPSEYKDSFIKFKEDKKLVQDMKNNNQSKLDEYDLRNVLDKLRLLYDKVFGGK